MFREFNVKFEDVEMLGGADNLLEGTEITKVIVRGDNNKMSSLDSMLKDCNELDTIDGELDLNGVSDIDNLLEGTELVKSINLKNINNENISANNSFPHIEEINIGGELYNKKAMQNVIASKEWTFDNVNYQGTVGDNIVTKEVNIVDDNKATIQDTLEQKATGIEIIGQTYENLVVGSGEATLLDELTLESIDGNSKEFNPHLEQPVCVEAIEGETYQNLIEGRGEYKLTDTFSTTWTESNDSIENPPSMIEIPEIFGNTVQGYANCVTAQQIVDSINNSAWTDGNSATLSPTDSKLYKVVSANSNGIDVNNISWIQLKANTTYSVTHYSTVYKCHFGTYVRCYENPSVATSITSGKSFTTGSSGKVFLYPVGYQGQWNWIRCVEGQVDLSQYAYDEMDLNYIQSVGDLYVDSEGTPILDDEGNEQYKLEIESYSDGNIFLNDGLLGFQSNSNWDVEKNGANSFRLSQKIRQSYLSSTPYILPIGEYTFTYNHTKIQGSHSGCDDFKVYLNNVRQSSTSGNVWKFTIDKPTSFYFSIRNYAEASATNIHITDYTFNLVRGDYNDYINIKSQSNKTTILMPCQLMKVSDGRDRLFWDVSKNKYVIEKNVRKLVIDGITNRFIKERTRNGYSVYNIPTYENSKPNGSKFINDTFPTNTDSNNDTSEWMMPMWSPHLYLSISEAKGDVNTWFKNNPTVTYYHSTIPETIETKILEKPSLETYSPKTYITTNTEIQPSQMTVTNKRNLINLKKMKANTDYTIQLKCNEKGNNPIKINLCGKEKDIDATIGVNHINVTTNELNDNRLELSGEGNIVSEIIVVEGEMNQYPEYFNGVQSVGELQGDGTYKIEVLSRCQLVNANSFVSGRLDRGILGYQNDSTVTINGEDIECVTSSAWRGCVSGFAKINPNTEYSFKYNVVSDGVEVMPCPHFYTKDKTYISDLYNQSTFTSPIDAEYVRIYFACGVVGSFIIKDFDFSRKMDLSIHTNSPLAKGDKLYWNKSNKRYEIDRGGSVEVPTVIGNVIDLPRLYQGEDTYFSTSTGNIKPSKIKLDYNDLD